MAKKRKIRGFFWLIILCIAAIAGYWFYQSYFKAKIKLKDDYEFIYVQSAFDLNDIIFELKENEIITEPEKFEWLAHKMELDKNIHPGKYRITNGMTYRQIINLLKYNKQEKVELFINSQIHDLDEFIEYVSKKLELEKSMLEDYFNDDTKLNRDFNLNRDNAFCAILSNTYHLNWAISLPDFIEEIKGTYNTYWTEERKKAAVKNTGLNIPDVMIMASIVQNESGIPDEQEKIAGVYLNRLKKNMLLQADPTLVFANKAWGSQRVYDKDKEIDSPYNTYRYKGLPPGPISLVSTRAITNVINYKRHNYLFFCAKPELNGYSNYAETYEEHQRYARSYRQNLDKKGIK